jgi:hypothetical protein
VAIALPGTDVEPMLDWAATSRRPYDERLGAWYRSRAVDVEYTWPSLVDHGDGPSLVEHHDRQPRSSGRVAWRHGTPATWDTTSLRI